MRKLTFILTAALFPMTMSAQLVINEVMQSNIDCIITDEKNDTPDSWVELYNVGTASVDLSAYSIGLTDKIADAYRLPAKSIPAKGYVIVYCDKDSTGLHTPFRLESGKGGSIYLFNGSAVADSYVEMKKQPAPNIAYGRETDGGSKLGYMLKPTPNAANEGGVVSNKNILGEPVFTEKGCVLTSGTRKVVHISLPEGSPEGTVIRYTTDGTEPTASSTLLSETGSLVIRATTTVRAKLFCDGYLSPRSTTQSYIFHNRAVTVPVVSIVTDRKYFYDNKIGIYVDGNYNAEAKNYSYDWRRPINIEYFTTNDADAVINQLCETRIQGGQSRGSLLKSLAVYANKRFGEKRFTYEFFPTEKPGITEFKSFILRNSGNDFDYLYYRDAAIQHNAAMNCDVDWQAWQPAAIYFNGEYLGLLNVRERSNEDNIYSNYDGLEDIDMIENWVELKTGTMTDYNKFKDFYTASANVDNTNMDKYAEMMDIDEYLNVMAINIFHNNLDFPGNNIVMWKPQAEGGKWRLIMKDTDFGLGLYGRDYKYKYLDWLYNHDFDTNNQWANEYEHTRLFRRLMTDQRFKDRFIDRMTIFMGSFLNGDGLAQVIDSMNSVMITEYGYHRNKHYPNNPWWPNQTQEYNDAKKWAKNRTTFMWTYLKDYFQISGNTQKLNVNQGVGNEINDFRFTLNDTWLKSGTYSGNFWTGREVRIKAESKDGASEIKKWTVKVTANGSTTTNTYEGSTCAFTYPTNATVVSVTPFIEATGIQAAEIDSNSAANANNGIYTLDGKKVAAPTNTGIYIVKAGNSVKKIVKK